MIASIKEHIKRIPGVQNAVRRMGLTSRGSWLFRREVLEWMQRPAVVEQLPLSYRLFARYASGFFSASDAQDLPAGRALFRVVSAASRLAGPNADMARLSIDDMEVVVDLRDPRFLQVVNELTRSVDTAFLKDFVQPGDTFMDVGANHGAFALVASRIVGKDGHVVAVEPQPHLARAVDESLHATAQGSFKVYALALGDREGHVDLLIPQSYSGAAGVFSAYSGTHPHRRVTVPLRRCDEVFDWEQFPGSLFVKLDVEGSEYAFLQGAREMIRARRPVLLMEINAEALEASTTSEQELKALLHDLGYTEYAELDAHMVRHPLSELNMAPEISRNVLLFSAA